MRGRDLLLFTADDVPCREKLFEFRIYGCTGNWDNVSFGSETYEMNLKVSAGGTEVGDPGARTLPSHLRCLRGCITSAVGFQGGDAKRGANPGRGEK
jgi:hypothetical protein